MYCTNCGTQNDDAYKFCMKCGSPMENMAQSSVSADIEIKSPVPREQPAFPQQAPQSYFAQRDVRSQYMQQTGTPQINRAALPFDVSNLSALNIWGPFAGYGTRRRHIGWVMDNKGEHAKELIQTVNTKFQDRQVPGVSMSRQTLVARGLFVENRPYFIFRRGLVSLALHITQFGKDLFISLASYLKPPISNFRVIVFALMLLFGAYLVFIFPNSLSNALDRAANSLNLFGGSMSTEGLFSLLCLIGPLGTINNIALLLFFIYGGYSWLSERDFWKGLRVAPNEFNEDDLMAMEKAVEQTVRISLDEIGLNPDELRQSNSPDIRRLI